MRDCEKCIYAKPFGGPNDNRCGAWSCEFIDRNEAIELWKAFKNGELIKKKPNVMPVLRSAT